MSKLNSLYWNIVGSICNLAHDLRKIGRLVIRDIVRGTFGCYFPYRVLISVNRSILAGIVKNIRIIPDDISLFYVWLEFRCDHKILRS